MFLVLSACAGCFALYTIVNIIYRVTFHPLANYPGPWQRAVSHWPQALGAIRGNAHVDVQALHEKYGNIVRIAPDTLAFRSAEAVHKIYDRKANVIKTGWTDVGLEVNPNFSTHNLNDVQLHAKRRRLLANAFSESALRNLEGFVIDRISAFCNIMGQPKDSNDLVNSEKNNWSKPRNMSIWANNLTLDVLGELCFGKTFRALEAGYHMTAELLLSSASFQQTLAYTPGRHLLYPFLRNQTLINKIKTKTVQQKVAFRAMMIPLLKARFALEEESKANQAETRHDFMHYLIQARDPETNEKFSPLDLTGEAALLVGAGSDTTSTCISATTFYLVRHPEVLKKLQEEVRSAFDNINDIKTGPQLSSLVYLRACIDEGLRMSPPVPGVLHRKVLPGGMEIDGHHVPAGMVVGSAAYSVHHNESEFPNSFEYIPERWIPGSKDLPFSVTEESVEQQKKAFIPFSIGPRNCIGKNMAIMELLITIARLVWLYDVRKVAGDSAGEGGKTDVEGRQRVGEYQLIDYFIVKRDGPWLEFRRRDGVEGLLRDWRLEGCGV